MDSHSAGIHTGSGADAQPDPNALHHAVGAAAAFEIAEGDPPAQRRALATLANYLIPYMEAGGDLYPTGPERRLLDNFQRAIADIPVDEPHEMLAASVEFTKANRAAMQRLAESVPVPGPKGAEPEPNTAEHEFIWADMLEADFPPVRWIVDQLIPQGAYTVLLGPPKIGKSTMARNGAVCILTGREWLGRTTRNVPVIYATFEGSKSSIRDHFSLMDLDRAAPLLVYKGPKLDAAIAWAESRIDYLKELTGCDTGVMFLDTLWRFLPNPKDENYTTVSAAMQDLLDLAERTGWAVVGIHHTGKGRNFSFGEESLGSQAIIGAADQIVSIGRREERVWYYTLGRDGEQTEETEIEFDRDLKWATAGRTRQATEQEDLDSELLRFIEEQDGWMKTETIRQEFEGNRQKVGAALIRMAKEGLLEQRGEGKRGSPYEYRIRQLD